MAATNCNITPPNTGLIDAEPFLINMLYSAYANAQHKAGKIHTAIGGDDKSSVCSDGMGSESRKKWI